MTGFGQEAAKVYATVTLAGAGAGGEKGEEAGGTQAHFPCGIKRSSAWVSCPLEPEHIKSC